jgi:CarboxypepD_reg-like domain/TonB-dependent Receptor Plug Domain
MKKQMKKLFTLLTILISLSTFGQNILNGIITDEKNNPIAGANIYLDGTYDGVNTDSIGKFSFETSTAGTQTLVISFLTYETIKKQINVDDFKNKTIKLRESVNSLDAVVITAGTFEAGEKARVTVLKALDIVTTAGSNANIVAALQTLPGTQTVGEDGRLFVRGGEADEAQTYIDGIRVAQPYGAAAQNLPTRGRFSPFLFSGMSFSTGGYSAEYGDALSSVLLLNTQDEAVQEKTDISLMTVGAGLAKTKIWGKSSLSINTAYINLAPYIALIPQRVEWNKPYQSLSGESVFRHTTTKGIFKFYAAYDGANFDLNQDNINETVKTKVGIKNNNFYLNTSYKGDLGNKWALFTGISYGNGKNDIGLSTNSVDNHEDAIHAKLRLKKLYSDRFKMTFGTDYFYTKFDENLNFGTTFHDQYRSQIAAIFSEADIFFSKNIAAKIGLRISNNSYLKETTVSPRVSFAYKTGRNGQISLAYGDFAQAPRQDYLKFADYLKSEKAAHYILNYQYSKEKQTFRTEVYYKDYSNLVKYNTPTLAYNAQFDNKGSGYAQGIDVFWRDGKSVKNLEYWLSYSYIDSKRDYKNFPYAVTPSFVANHSLSIVGKYWVNKWKSQISITNTYTTGRPYNNPNATAFMSGKTKDYHNLSMSWAYLISTQKILYFSMSNVLGAQNVFGYEYANNKDLNNIYPSREITPQADRFLFLGFFWTISNDKKDNQLKNL